ncbi:MAG: 3-demethylubiquinone-9 3-O-methyltransferase [Bdellovibrionales bacterium GWB1_52_6]|nr:MAG: 3-demethylubiquinone-9 3-O-methyltransferase [Bdellovibrionales bacterium GWB1_52_6]OFZ05541.1 MAG: 3-demethylubiquinone-9 3-O-methyltransferase [Bdellovibrionales bacterium GWA1_52_35]HCM39090.1 3-demethylubiquinone-9 3-O-methyltransferase [Bdellovibrionales bacterium]
MQSKPPINNQMYDDFGDLWYEGSAHPVALLRAEARLKDPWVLREIQSRSGRRPTNILDMGCGGGLLANYLAKNGFKVTGVDLSAPSLEIARKRDTTHSVIYLKADATRIPVPSHTYNVVCAMDFLEHVNDPEAVLKEAARILKPGGLFFFHTFNRTFLSWLLAVKGVHWFVKNTPKNLHVFDLFIKPEELTEMGKRSGLELVDLRGAQPRFNRHFWKMLVTREVNRDFEFVFTPSLKLGYLGIMKILSPSIIKR